MTDISSLSQLILQTGAVGVLAIVLYYAYKYFKHMQAKSDEKDEKVTAFLQGLVTSAGEQQAEFQKAWKQMAKDAIEQQANMTSVLESIKSSVERHSDQCSVEHQEIIQRLYIMNEKSVVR